jgi:group I intron endonuclease
MAFIYCFIFPNDKRYIGFSTKNVKQRWSMHKHHAKNGVKNKLYNAIRKYGFDNIEKIILIEHPDKKYTLEILESLYIEKFNSIENGYNTAPGGGNFPIMIGNTNPSYIRKGKPMKEWLTEEQINNYIQATKDKYKGSKNVHARKVKIISPNEEEFIVHGTLQQFCKDHNLSFNAFFKELQKEGGIIPKISSMANRLKYIEQRENSIGWSIFPLD